MLYFVITIIAIVVLLIYFALEWDSVTYGISELFTSEFVGLPTSRNNLKHIMQILEEENIDISKLYLIDFGCGKGDVLDEYQDAFKRSIGIELNSKLARIAKKRHRKNRDVRIHATDILKYDFKRRPTLLYAYEPLWQVDKRKARKIYRRVIDSLSEIGEIGHPVYIVYLTGISRSDMAPPFFKDEPFELIRYAKMGFIPYRDLYIYRYAKASN